MARNKELNGIIGVISSEKLELNSIVLEHENKIEALTSFVEDAEAKISDLGRQLSESIDEQHARIEQARHARHDLRGVKIELEQMKASLANQAALSQNKSI